MHASLRKAITLVTNSLQNEKYSAPHKQNQNNTTKNYPIGQIQVNTHIKRN